MALSKDITEVRGSPSAEVPAVAVRVPLELRQMQILQVV